MKLSVIVPAYNEGVKIYDNLLKINEIFSSFDFDYEIIVVNDGSSDNTFAEVRRAAKVIDGLIVCSYRRNRGKGHAIVNGFSRVSGDFVTFLDADLDLPPDQIEIFFNYMSRFSADVVVGSKRHPDSVIDYPFYRKFLSNCYYLFNKFLFNLSVKDTQVGLKLYKREVLDKVIPKISVKGFAFDLEILVNVNHLGFKIVECPIRIEYQRDFGRIGLRDIKNIFQDTIGIFYRLRILRFYDS